MGESKSPALPLGDGALSHIILTELSCYVKEKDSVLSNFFEGTLLQGCCICLSADTTAFHFIPLLFAP